MNLTKNTKLVILAIAIPSTIGLVYLLIKSLTQAADEEEERSSKNHATSRQTIIEVPIPRKAVGSIIGRQGVNIKQLQENSGTRMNFKENTKDGGDGGDGDRTLVIRGTMEAAQSAECLIRKTLVDMPVLIQEEIMVPGYSLGRIIGRGGESIRQMSRTSNTKIFVDRTRENYRDKPRQIMLHGTKEQIGIARSLIQEKLDEEEEFRARSAVSAANREKGNRAKHSTTNMSQKTYQEVSSLNEEWETNKAAPSNTVSGTQILDYTLFPRTRPFVEVYVSAIADPGTFWVQVVSHMALKLDELSVVMTRYFQNEGQAHEDGGLSPGFHTQKYLKKCIDERKRRMEGSSLPSSKRRRLILKQERCISKEATEVREGATYQSVKNGQMPHLTQIAASEVNRGGEFSTYVAPRQKVYNRPLSLTLDKVKVGDIVAAPFENDDTWYRAKVMGFKDNELDLFYVDYGDSSYLDVSQCKTGSMDILSLPCQAIECHLAGLKPKGEWSEEAFDTFERLTYCAKWKVVVAKAETLSGPKPHLTLIDTNGDQDLNINEEMVRLGYAELNTVPEDHS